MRLASLSGGHDGQLFLVDKNMERAVSAVDIAPSLREAIEVWDKVSPRLQERYEALCSGSLRGAIFFEPCSALAALPRAFQFVDGSAYLAHVERVRRARGAQMPPSFLTDPLMYQAVSDQFLAPNEPIRIADEAWGIDLEAEVGVVTSHVSMGAGLEEAEQSIKLVLLINDVSLRNLIPGELGKGFGFLQSKPCSALSPVAITPDELDDFWNHGRVHRPLLSFLNGHELGSPQAGEDMQFGFPELVVHAARTRSLQAGTLVGSGTVANKDTSRGSSCLAEKRMLEIIEHGKATTPFLKFGDQVRIEMLSPEGASYFGAIEQTVEEYRP